MNQFRIYTRVNPESRETPFPLPVYVRSIGYKNMEKGYRERATELHSPFFEMIWCTHGIGEVILFQEAFQLFPNDVFFYYPNERHSFHALSEQWEVRWIAFDGPAATVFFEGYGYSRKMHAAGPCPLDLFEEIQTKIGDPSPVVFRSMPALLCRLLALAGGTAVHYICDEQSDWYPDMADIRRKINDRTKAIVIINPNNPTGALYPREVLQQIVDIAREHQLIIFSDEIYDRLVMDGEEHVSIASLAPDLFCVTYSGLSKSHMIAGFRIGWMIMSGNKKMAKDYMEGIKMLSNMRLCSNVPAQSIVQTALGGHQSVRSYVVPGGRIREQRDYIYKALTDIPGISAVKPKAAFYIFPKIDVKKFGIVNDEQFALDLLRDKKILLIHGGGFNWKQPDHFRVVFLPRIEVLKESVEKMADFFSYYHQ